MATLVGAWEFASAHGLATVATLVLLATMSSSAVAQSGQRYQALLQNGQRIQGKALTDWHQLPGAPRLDGQPLLDPGNPARWLHNRNLPVSTTPAAFIEMHTGDCLPGNVLEARTGRESKYDPLPAHLIVEPRVALEPPKDRPLPRLRVDTSYVRRIVWQRRRKLEYQPGTLHFRDGRMLQFEAFRLDGAAIQILLEEGARRVPFSDISELHLPAVAKPWDLHFSELTVLCTKPETRVWQLETTGGLVVTGSPERFVPRFEGNPNEPVRWVHGLQPAWSLDPLWVPIREVVMWRFFGQNEVPLQRACELHQGTAEADSVHWLANRNILQGPLRSLSTEFGFGLGMQAPGQFAFRLPPHAVALRAMVCLDRVVGRGGCARVRFRTAKGSPPIWESPLLLGSEVVADTGRIALPPSSSSAAPSSQQLIIELDQVHEGRPTGADPLDIRDHINVADGCLELDTAGVQRELEKRIPERFAAWKGWQFAPTKSLQQLPSREVQVSQERRQPDRGEEGFVPMITLRERPLSLTRELNLLPDDRWLVIAAARIRPQGPPVKLEVRIDGQPAAEFEIPELRGDANETPPLVVSLLPYMQAKATSIAVEIRQLPGPNDSVPVRWRTITTTDRLPTVCEVYDDQQQVAAESANPGGSATYVTTDRFSGRGSLELRGPGVFRLSLPQAVQIRERPQWGEYRFVRIAVRRPQKQKDKGRLSVEFQPAIAGRRPMRLDTGKGKPAFDSAVRVWDGELPEHWIIIQRDLYADFGEFELRDVLVSCFDGESLGLDHIYLGRGPGDLDRLPPKPTSWEDATTALKLWPNDIEKRLKPALVGIEFRDGRWTGGVVIKAEGEILVPGHALGPVNEDVTVHMLDGKTHAGKTRGICRDRDLGMVKIEKPQFIVAVPTWDVVESKLADDYVAMLLPSKLKDGFQTSPVQAEVRQAVRGRLWSPIDAPDAMPGGVLFHRHGYVMGLQVSRHPRGGLIFERPIQGGLPDPLPRLRNGEVFGQWPLGAEPLVGLTVKPRGGSQESGLVIDKIESPVAAAAGLKPGEVIVTCEGKNLFAASDLSQAIEQKDAEQEITLEVERNGAKQPVKLKLQRR